MGLEAPELESWLSQILDRDPGTFEDAYWGFRPDAALAVPRLFELLHSIHDPYSRGKILELLGESGDASVMSVIAADLEHPNEDIRNWAKVALSTLSRGGSWQQTGA